MSLSSIGFSRDLLQITMATFLPEVMDIESWGEYAAVAHQISTLSKLYPNSYNYGVSRSFAFAVSKRQGRSNNQKTRSVKSQGPHSHILTTGGPKDFFWSDILAKRDFFGSVKDAGIFRVAKTTEGFFWVLYFSSAQIKNNISAIYSFIFYQNQS